MNLPRRADDTRARDQVPASVAERVRVLLVDDQALIRRGLVTLLGTEPRIEVVGEAADGVRALALVAEVAPDVVLVDARMPGMDGVELVGRLRQVAPEVAAVMLTTFAEDAYIFGGLRAGARGYLLKDVEPDELVSAILRAARGDAVLAGSVTGRVIAELNRRPGPDAGPGLSGRELDVARLVATGASNAEISHMLFLSEGTVRNHVSKILAKLDLRDRTQLAVWAHRAGLGDGP